MRALPRAALCLTLAFLSAGYAPAAAQSAVAPGARVRITAPYLDREIGTLIALTADTLLARGPRGDTLAVPVAAISRLEVSRGRRKHTWRGAGIGLLVGTAAGAAISAATYHESDRSCPATDSFCGFDVSPDRGETVIAGAVLGGALGAAVGGVVGASRRKEAWRVVPLDRPRVGLAPFGKHAGVGVSLAF